MSQQIDAIYDDGVLKPLVPLSLPDKTRVKLTVDAQPAEKVARANGPEQDHRVVEAGPAADDFDAELSSLLFDGPTLPADFSRADIYADHD